MHLKIGHVGPTTHLKEKICVFQVDKTQERGAEASGSCFSLFYLTPAGVLFLNPYAFCYSVLHSGLVCNKDFFPPVKLLVLVKFLCNKTTVQAIYTYRSSKWVQ